MFCDIELFSLIIFFPSNESSLISLLYLLFIIELGKVFERKSLLSKLLILLLLLLLNNLKFNLLVLICVDRLNLSCTGVSFSLSVKIILFLILSEIFFLSLSSVVNLYLSVFNEFIKFSSVIKFWLISLSI